MLIAAHIGGSPHGSGPCSCESTSAAGEKSCARADNARVASIRASNAIEGAEVDDERAERLAGGARFRNRNEREFAGYRDAVDELMRAEPEPISVPLILHYHRQIYQHVDGRGGSFKSDDNAIVSYESGRRQASRFTIADIRKAVPGISDQTIRLVLSECRDAAQIRAEGTGRSAVWVRLTAPPVATR